MNVVLKKTTFSEQKPSHGPASAIWEKAFLFCLKLIIFSGALRTPEVFFQRVCVNASVSIALLRIIIIILLLSRLFHEICSQSEFYNALNLTKIRANSHRKTAAKRRKNLANITPLHHHTSGIHK